MASSIHGHEILEHIIAAGGTVRLPALEAFATMSFGGDATYYTCSSEGMTFPQLMEFLASRNKLRIDDGLVTVFAENMCRHEAGEPGHHHSHGG